MAYGQLNDQEQCLLDGLTSNLTECVGTISIWYANSSYGACGLSALAYVEYSRLLYR